MVDVEGHKEHPDGTASQSSQPGADLHKVRTMGPGRLCKRAANDGRESNWRSFDLSPLTTLGAADLESW